MTDNTDAPLSGSIHSAELPIKDAYYPGSPRVIGLFGLWLDEVPFSIEGL